MKNEQISKEFFLEIRLFILGYVTSSIVCFIIQTSVLRCHLSIHDSCRPIALPLSLSQTNPKPILHPQKHQNNWNVNCNQFSNSNKRSKKRVRDCGEQSDAPNAVTRFSTVIRCGAKVCVWLSCTVTSMLVLEKTRLHVQKVCRSLHHTNCDSLCWCCDVWWMQHILIWPMN